MPAITAAANPTVAIASTADTGKSVSGTEGGERPFAAVLAEQSGKSPRAGNEGQASQETKGTKSPSDRDEDSGDGAAAGPDALGSAKVAVSGNQTSSDHGDSEGNAMDAQIQVIVALMQANPPVATIPVPTNQGPTPGTAPVLAIAAQDSAALATTVDGRFSDDSTTRLQTAGKFQAQEWIAADASQVTAKVAAAADAAVAQAIKTDNALSRDSVALKLDVAQNAAATAAIALPVHTAAVQAVPGGHGDYRITTPVGSPNWDDAVGNSLVVMTGSGRDRADLVLTPPQLGRVEVSITVKGDEASAVFVSGNPAVREALENALPRLREILADAGINLGQAQIGGESPGQSAGDRQSGDNARYGASGTDSPGMMDTAGSTAPLRVISRSLVDTYA